MFFLLAPDIYVDLQTNMTVKGFWDRVKKYAGCRKLVPQSSLKGYRVAIDALGVFFRLRMRSRTMLAKKWDVVSRTLDEKEIDKLWFKEIVTFLSGLMVYGITPVVVAERGTPPLKVARKGEREAEREDHQHKIDELRSTLKKQDEYDRSREQVEKLRKLEGSLKVLTQESKDACYDLVVAMGVPICMCKEGIEAEKVAAILALEGCAAAYSPDGDSFVSGACPILIRGSGEDMRMGNCYVKTFEIVYLKDVLANLELTHAEFVDVCILAGCDYNENIKYIGFAIGVTLIKTYGSIEEIPRSVLVKRSRQTFTSLDCLRHEECRREFTVPEGGARSLVETTYFGFTIDNIQVGKCDEDAMTTLGMGQKIEGVQRSLDMVGTPSVFDHRRDTLACVRDIPACK